MTIHPLILDRLIVGDFDANPQPDRLGGKRPEDGKNGGEKDSDLVDRLCSIAADLAAAALCALLCDAPAAATLARRPAAGP
jgi:hypothetical protein